MKRTRFNAFLFTSLLSIPFFASAQTSAVNDVKSGITSLSTIVTTFNETIVTSLVTLAGSIALLAFFYGIIQYIWGVREGQQEKIKNGNKFMLYGLIALFVMFSVWGIIIFFQRIFNIEGQNTIIIPKIQLQGGSTSNSASPSTANGALPSGANTTGSGSASAACSGIASEAARERCLANQQTTSTAADEGCAGKKQDDNCRVSGYPGTCGVHEEGGPLRCYATPGGCPVKDANGVCAEPAVY